MKKSYVLTKNFKSPYVVSTGQPHRPTQIKMKKFTAGQIINGELKHANGRPAFILVHGVIVVPLSVVKAVVTKDVVETSSAEGAGNSAPVKKIEVVTNPKVKYIDAALIGGVIGAAVVWYAERKKWIAEAKIENKLYGALAGAVVSGYLMYRFRNKKDVKLSKPTKD